MSFTKFLPTLTRALCLVAFFSLVVVAQAAKPRKAAAPPPANDYKGYIVIDADSGKVIEEERADEMTPPASMTKLMTFAVLQDKIRAGSLTLQTPITVTAEDSRMGGTQVYLKEGETFSVEELIYAMMIQSANDAAYALARTASGNAEAFVAEMNAKAASLCMTHTLFRSPHGLPPASRKIAEGDLSTPRDFSLLCRYLLKNTDILTYTSIRTRSFGQGVREPKRVVQMTNHNHLLGRVAGVDGFKTGYTKGAGYCLSTTALRNGRRIIVVLMGSSERKARDHKISELIEYGFAHLPPPVVVKAVAKPQSSAPASAPQAAPTQSPAQTSAGAFR